MRRADAIAGVVGSAIATGGLSLLSADWSSLGDVRPIYTSLTITIQSVKKKSSIDTFVAGSIKTDAISAKATRVIYERFSDEWLKAHVAGLADNKANNPQPASAVPVKKSMADATAKQ